MTPIRIDAAGKTDRGQRRSRNEDQYLVADLEKVMRIRSTSLQVEDQTRLSSDRKGCVLVVADGMGGHGHGDTASSLAVGAVTHYTLNMLPWFFHLDPKSDDDLKEELGKALKRCQAALDSEAAAHPEERGMGTTVTLCYVSWPKAYVVHAGDSRAYVFRSGKLTQITTDHTFAQQLVDAGTLGPDQAAEHPYAHVLYNAIQAQGDKDVHPEVKRLSLKPEDVLLLVTDGVTKHVDEAGIEAILAKDGMASEVADMLVDAANEGGGSDNITVAVARFRKTG